MSLVVMRRKLAAKNKLNKNGGTRGGISSNGGFSLAYTNTGKHLMGRITSRATVLPPLLRSQKNRRVDCCKGASQYMHSKRREAQRVGSTVGIKQKPIIQVSQRNRLKKLSQICLSDCGEDVSGQIMWKLSPDQYASSLTERLAAMALNSEDGCIYNYTVTVVNDGGNKFLLDKNKNLQLIFKVGNTYIFDMSDSTNATHPLRFSTSSAMTDKYEQLDIIGTAGEKNAKVIFRPKEKGDVWIYCKNHGIAMGSYYNGTGITVKDSNENLSKEELCKKTKIWQQTRSQNSLTRGRIDCGTISMTKDVKKNVSASDQINRVKSRTLNASCVTDIKPFNTKKCNPPGR